MESLRKSAPGLTATFLVAILFLALLPAASAAGKAWTTDKLNTLLNASSPNEFSSVLVFMDGQLDVQQISNQNRLAKYTRQASHEILVEKLQQFARDNQADIKQVLEQGLASGDVASYESYWIASAFQVKAKPAFIQQIINRVDVGAVIEDVPMEALRGPTRQSEKSISASAHVGTASTNLHTIGADSMWALGYTGQGRLVCSFDSGVDGAHPALAGSWRGVDHSAAESWFDPVYQQDFPHSAPDLDYETAVHGTRSMGVMVGKDDITGDTTGVAFGAQWISAMVIDIPGANYLQAFQWAADPDGDPNTIEDVPDVVNNSWGFKQSVINCLDIFWIPIDNLEALGCVCVFACGNEGYVGDGSFTIRNPANRATSETNTFSVGATNKYGDDIWYASSRGPSDCDSVSVKPEVVAPGDSVFTTSYPNTGGAPDYIENATGTSFAAPHVSGAVALLRQYNPNATVDEIKLALMNSATDMGDPGNDNTYGYGLINIPKAMSLLPPNDQVNIFVQSLEYDQFAPGDSVDFVVNLKNSGPGTIGVEGQLINPGPGVDIITSDIVPFGNIETDSTASNAFPLRIAVSNDFLLGAYATVQLRITDDSGYEKTITLFLRVGPLLLESKANISADSVNFTITNYGLFGLANGSAFEGGGLGFRYLGTGNVNNLFQCAFLMGVSPDSVSDAVSNVLGSIDHDFTVAPGGNLVSYDNGTLGDHETFSRFDDSYSFKPIGITVEQRTATYDGASNGKFVVLEFTLSNETSRMINGLYAGMYFDWDFPAGSAGSDMVSFHKIPGGPEVGYMWQNSAYNYRGTALLSDDTVSTFWDITNLGTIYSSDFYPLLTEAVKYEFLTHGLEDTASFAPEDQSYSIACGPFDLAPGESDTLAFAVLAATTQEDLFASASKAQSLYRTATPVNDHHDVVLPNNFVLEQNYPNPFNPITRINFTLPKASHTRLTVFNSLGQRVAVLSDQMRPAGSYSVVWNGLSDEGQQVASGVYFYRLETNDVAKTRKMILMK